jgi:hypothetical protein
MLITGIHTCWLQVLVVMSCAWGILAVEAMCLLFECGCLVFSGLASESMKCGEKLGTSSEKITSIADQFYVA